MLRGRCDRSRFAPVGDHDRLARAQLLAVHDLLGAGHDLAQHPQPGHDHPHGEPRLARADHTTAERLPAEELDHTRLISTIVLVFLPRRLPRKNTTPSSATPATAPATTM